MYSRGLGPGGVLSELAVMDGEIWTKVTAELHRTDGAERGHNVTTATTKTLLSGWLPGAHKTLTLIKKRCQSHLNNHQVQNL